MASNIKFMACSSKYIYSPATLLYLRFINSFIIVMGCYS